MQTQYNDPKGAAGAVKVPLGLIPPHAMEQTAWVHKLGAEKYGRKVPVFACSKGEELEEFCTCGHSTLNQHAIPNAHTQLEGSVSSVTIKNTQRAKKPNVTQGGLFGLKDSVNLVTINTLEKLIQNIKNNKKQQQTLGFPQTKSMSKNKPLNGIEGQRYEIGITHVTEKELSFLSDLVSKMKSEYLKNKTMGAQFVAGQQEEEVYLTSTTTTPPEDSEVLFATDATKDLACSETILRLLKKHSPTCAVQNLIVRDGEVEQYGAYNWRRTGVCASTYVNAILRHLNAWRDGEDLDPESGISHLAHVACNANILMDAGYCGKLQDDRNTTRQCNEVEEAYDDWDSLDEEKEDLRVKLLKSFFKLDKYAEAGVEDDCPEAGYRILKEDEELQDGDEIYVGEGHWCPVYVASWATPSVVYRGTYRRKLITNCDLKERQSCPECDALASYGTNDGPCDYHKSTEVADCDLKEECKCGRHYVYHWLYGWICEDCDLKLSDYYP